METPQETAAKLFAERADRSARMIAAKLGSAANVTEIPQEKEVYFWNLRDPSVDPSLLLQSGMPIDQILDKTYPYRRKMMTHSRPNPKDQVQYAERMKKLSEEIGTKEHVDHSVDY